jgi:hypothetical protein
MATINRTIEGAITLLGGLNYQLNLPSNSAPKQNALAEYNLEEVFVNCDTQLGEITASLPSVATFGGDRSVKIYIKRTGIKEVTVIPFANALAVPPIQDTINGIAGGWVLGNGQTGYFQIVSNGNWAFFSTNGL